MVQEDDNIFDTSIPVLSHFTYREAHALQSGFYKGFTEGSRDAKYEKDRHYWQVAYVLGACLRYYILWRLIKVY